MRYRQVGRRPLRRQRRAEWRRHAVRRRESGGANALAKTSEIPVGGGKILSEQGIVVTQPTKGEFKGFSNICTHQGCPVSAIAGGTINCTCHGSQFSITDGSVKAGPASKPLPAKDVKVSGDNVTLA